MMQSYINRKASLISLLLCIVMIFSLAACGETEEGEGAENAKIISKDDVANPKDIEDLKLDNTKWKHDDDNDVYYQIGVSYVTDAEDEDVEKLAIYVPGAYMDSKDNGDGTYTCTINTKKKVKGYTSETAPIVMPVNTSGYAEQTAATEYSYNDISKYMKAGCIYVLAGCRGRQNFMDRGNGGPDSSSSAKTTETKTDTSSSSGNTETGAPWGVTDIKAAIRYLRYNAANLAGDTEKIFVFGMSGGGAQSSVIGSSGDSNLYYSYLGKIGAAMRDDDGNYISDAVSGVMAWCPITNLDTANEAYEWMMGQYSSDGTRANSTWTKALSDDMAEVYAEYINRIGLTDGDGNTLTLNESDDGIYTSGSYYEYLKETIEGSLNNFLKGTKFPYTSRASREMAGMDENGPAGAPSGKKPDGEKPSGDFDGKGPDGMKNDKSDGSVPKFDGKQKGKNNDINGNSSNKNKSSNANESDMDSKTTYKTVRDYIDHLNEDGEWVKYNSKTGKVKITSVEAFVKHCKNATKDVGAFDSVTSSETENEVFGTEASDGLHFDTYMTELIQNNASEYAKLSDYDDSIEDAEKDLSKKDSIGNTVVTRSNMYNPMYYISAKYDGYGTSNIAKYWRINTGIEQGDTSLTTEMNLALALEQNDDVKEVDFTTVWEQEHTMAERSGDGTTNFISWVNECCK